MQRWFLFFGLLTASALPCEELPYRLDLTTNPLQLKSSYQFHDFARSAKKKKQSADRTRSGKGSTTLLTGEYYIGTTNAQPFTIVTNGNIAGGTRFALNGAIEPLNNFHNVALGLHTLQSNSTGGSLVALGYGTDVLADGLTNAIVIGAGASVGTSNTIQLGNSEITSLFCQVGITTPSDMRLKVAVEENVPGLSFITKLRPVTYCSLKDVESTQAEVIKTGLIAQEVEQAANEAGYNFNGLHKPQNERDCYGLSYELFVVPLVKAMQEQQVLIEQLQEEIADLTSRLDKLSKNDESPYRLKKEKAWLK